MKLSQEYASWIRCEITGSEKFRSSSTLEVIYAPAKVIPSRYDFKVFNEQKLAIVFVRKDAKSQQDLKLSNVHLIIDLETGDQWMPLSLEERTETNRKARKQVFYPRSNDWQLIRSSNA